MSLVWLGAVIAGVLAALAQYHVVPLLAGRRGARPLGWWMPALARAGAIAFIVALVFDAPLGTARVRRPLVALDVSASWTRGGDSAAFSRALRRARAEAGGDSVLLVGDSVRVAPMGAGTVLATDASTRLRPLVDQAVASGRALLLVSDGEADDADAIAEAAGGSRVIVERVRRGADVAIVELQRPRVIGAADTLELRATIIAGERGAGAGVMTAALDGMPLGRTSFAALEPWAEREVLIRAPLAAGTRAARLASLTVHLQSPGDLEPRNDRLTAPLEIVAGARVVFVSSAPDFDARYALAVLRGTLSLPTRAYLRVAPGQWRSAETLQPVGESVVRAAASAASVLVLHGDSAIFGAPATYARGSLGLLLPASRSAPAPDDEWYARSSGSASPLRTLLSDAPWDSLPPIALNAVAPRGNWTALLASRGRAATGASRAAVVGRDGSRRTVIIDGSGYWRWRFRGGAAAEVYSALLGGSFDWLAAERGEQRGVLPVANMLREGETVRWQRSSALRDSVITMTLRRRGAPAAEAATRVHLAFADGVAESPPLALGTWDASGPGGTTALTVNPSREWIPRRPTLRTGEIGGAVIVSASSVGARAFGWLYLAAVALLCAEWWLRRRIGLR